MKELPKVYNSIKEEDKIYRIWKESKFFNPDNLPGIRKEPFTISLPPPNATGVLHIGHAIMLAIQDLVIRYQRMRGKKTLWLPGTDHAAIATQAIVEKKLKSQGKTKYDLGREKFLEKVEEYIKKSQGKIKNQMEKMGVSCDWSRERYTLDKGLSSAVREAFIRMHKEGLIYRGLRIVNWCPHCESTLSDDEVTYVQQKAKFYYIKYGPFVVATTRPETKIGDTAVAVNPKDNRYKKYIGKDFNIKLGPVSIKIKVIADRVVDSKFGTGALGVTPAHSMIDYELAQKNNLRMIQVVGPDNKMTKEAGPYAGLTVLEAREQFINDLKKSGQIEKIEDIDNKLSVCYRCNTAVEPLLSKQWFVDVNKKLKINRNYSLKDLAIQVVRNGQIKIIPKQFEKVYFNWLENLRDWCISRQLWFGHRIPVYYCQREISNSDFLISNEDIKNSKLKIKNLGLKKCPPIVSLEKPKSCPSCGFSKLEQDPDTLDTWFSSSLWTFSTLGWPKKTKDLKIFHPTSLIESGYDILFFWVARMIIMSNYLVGEVPFREVYLHGLIRDKDGDKMSKSKPETAIDPLEIIKKYGADAFRLSFLIGNTPGNDLIFYEEKIAGFRNFVNKFWNISRYILMTVENPRLIVKEPTPKTLADKWILSELNELIRKITEGLEKYQFSLAGEQIYEFTWSKLADWYIEQSKVKNQGQSFSSQESKASNEILLYVLQNLLKLWHPFTPFVTEVIWKNIVQSSDFKIQGKLLMIQDWPKSQSYFNQSAVKDFELIQKVIVAIRNVRAESNVPAAKKVNVIISAGKKEKMFIEQAEVIKFLARVENLKIEKSAKAVANSAKTVVSGVEIFIELSGIIDIKLEKKRISNEINEAISYIKGIKVKMLNKNFIEKAPKQIVEAEREKLATQQEKLKKLKEYLKSLR